jgi:lipoprotein NlpI
MIHISETAYFLAKAEMSLGEWNAAIDHLKTLFSQKVV